MVTRQPSMNKVLSRMPSDLLQMTFAELGEAREGGDADFTGISMDELLAGWTMPTVSGGNGATTATAADAGEVAPRVAEKRLDRQDTSWKGKTLEDVWKVISDTKLERAAAAAGNTQTQKTDLTLQQVLQAFVNDPDLPSIDAPSLPPPPLGDEGAGASRPVSPIAAHVSEDARREAAKHARELRMRKRKAQVIAEAAPPEEDEATRLAKERMVKNRESAARSRAKRQQYTHELERELSKLKRENNTLKKDLVLNGKPEVPSQHKMSLRSGRSAPPALFHASLEEAKAELAALAKQSSK
ncbi:hypothetical protein PPROV_000262600 [Pycnococcus provasolii]|uniref:BZIP domain-containing protein n=1 Tax=Pycnococcus provasolii TaxID=41880 RepID=A0A830HB48_9CHLO|nr:hypothetical protein PPROV_000262600 [Pycnococcus provasolii]